MASTRYESDSSDTSLLGQPLEFEFSGQTAPNRFLKSAMTERMASWDPENLEARGVPSRELVNLYKRWGEGDIGLIITGNILIEYDHIEAAGNCVISRKSSFSGERFEAYKAMAAAGKKHGSLFVGQLNHPGRQVSSNFQKHPISANVNVGELGQ
jgi:2,4-dienoyl-CoA reductase-like NADH-dependent reductase (Old Yellow Enzyme family)